LGQRELGILLGFEPEVAQGRVSHYESGRRSVDPDIAYRFIAVAAERGDEFTLEDVFPAPKPHSDMAGRKAGTRALSN
jgi:hypothetical protein